MGKVVHVHLPERGRITQCTIVLRAISAQDARTIPNGMKLMTMVNIPVLTRILILRQNQMRLRIATAILKSGRGRVLRRRAVWRMPRTNATAAVLAHVTMSHIPTVLAMATER